MPSALCVTALASLIRLDCCKTSCKSPLMFTLPSCVLAVLAACVHRLCPLAAFRWHPARRPRDRGCRCSSTQDDRSDARKNRAPAQSIQLESLSRRGLLSSVAVTAAWTVLAPAANAGDGGGRAAACGRTARSAAEGFIETGSFLQSHSAAAAAPMWEVRPCTCIFVACSDTKPLLGAAGPAIT